MSATQRYLEKLDEEKQRFMMMKRGTFEVLD